MDILKLVDRPIAFQRSFVRLTGGICPALLLSQMVYWARRTDDPEGWFYKTAEEWQDETGMTRFELEGARKKLRELGLTQEKRQGMPCQLFFKVNGSTLMHLMEGSSMPETSKPVCQKPANQYAGNQQTASNIGTETTTETTPSAVCIPQIPAALDTPEFRQAWSDYETHRRQKKVGRLTAVGVAAKMREMEGWGVAVAIASINNSIGHGWTGIFPPKDGAAKPADTIQALRLELEQIGGEFVGIDSEAENARRRAARDVIRKKIETLKAAHG